YNKGKIMDKKEQAGKEKEMSRKDFLSTSAAATAGFFVVPRHVLGGAGYKAPSDRLNIARIGAGGMGASNTKSLSDLGENIYALCDVDDDYAANTLYDYPKPTRYIDFRDMLATAIETDAV